MLPRFKRMQNGDLRMGDSKDADKGVASSSLAGLKSEKPETVAEKAKEAVAKGGGDVNNKSHVLGMYSIQFGKYRGQTFKWMLENCLGYAGWLVDDMRKEPLSKNVPISANKHSFKEYVQSFPEGVEAVAVKRERREAKLKITASTPSKSVLPASQLFKLLPPDEARKRIRESSSRNMNILPKIPVHSQPSPRKLGLEVEHQTELSDDVLASAAEAMEAMTLPIRATTSTSADKQRPATSRPISSKPAVLQPATIKPQHKKPAEGQLSGILPLIANVATTTCSTVATLQIIATTMQSAAPANVATTTCTESMSSTVAPQQKTITTTLQPAAPVFPIVESWKSSLPKVDIQWISKMLFSTTTSGKPALDDRKIDRLWYYPPTPQLVPTSKPKLDRYFGHRLFLWMPNRIFKMKLICPNCNVVELTRQGPYRSTRMVLDVDDFYILAGEWLYCSQCKKNWISWNESILNQLDPGTRSKFPIQILYKTACDNRVIFLLHQRGLGNSPSQLQKKISELHNTSWTTKQLQYLSDCKVFRKASENLLVAPASFDEPPTQIPVPKYQWFIRVYCQEVSQRLDEVKASITSVFGRVLKLDSTKKLTKKLAGEASRTAGWATSISNEHGQVLQCVLTVGEGEGIGKLVEGIVSRYRDASVRPPALLYVDSHCCGKHKTMDIFRSAWPDVIIRLDVWHFMRRLATCVTTDTHRLYAAFMGQLSHAIFQWDKSDLALLKTAKRSQFVLEGKFDITEGDVVDSLTRKELALHCRRRTRGTEETIRMLHQILEMFDGEQGKDTMGVPLFHRERIWEEWRIQRNHVHCLQDPEDIPLYTKTGTLKKGLVELPVYRCARGSTSLESFHLHLARFIPGTSANANNFQAYLLEGLMRWNEDRATAATSSENDSRIYSSKLRHFTNSLSEEVLGQKIFQQHKDPLQYTGELIGIEYLFNQTGKAFQVDKVGTTEEEEEEEDLPQDEGFEDLVDLDDPTINKTETLLTPEKSGQSTVVKSRPSCNLVQLPPECDLPDNTAPIQTLESLTQSSAVHHRASVDAAATISRAPDTTDSTPDTISESYEGPYNAAGYDHVVSLAEYLYQLNEKTVKAISNAEADKIIALWNALAEVDRSPTRFRDRYKPQLIKGRFKAPKQTRTELLPGVQSVKRCALAPHLGPATWPDSNRYQEALISRLCMRYPSSTSKDGRRQARWNLVITAYNTIREMLFNCPKVMRETNLQLADISHRTLTAWFSARGKRRERDTLEQGLQLPSAPAVAQEPLVPALDKPNILQSGSAQPLQFTIHENTSGQRKKARRQIFPKEPVPQHSSPIPILPATVPQQPITIPISVLSTTSFKPHVPPTSTVQTPVQPVSKLPYSTKFYQKRKLEAEMAGDCKRKYIKKADVKLCLKCGQDRKIVNHPQYYGHIYCSSTAGITHQEWVDDLKSKGVGKRKDKTK